MTFRGCWILCRASRAACEGSPNRFLWTPGESSLLTRWIHGPCVASASNRAFVDWVRVSTLLTRLARSSIMPGWATSGHWAIAFVCGEMFFVSTVALDSGVRLFMRARGVSCTTVASGWIIDGRVSA
ncbi:unnamed protein product [Cochlearia groenlandica]